MVQIGPYENFKVLWPPSDSWLPLALPENFKVLWPPFGSWLPLALPWSPPGLETNKKLPARSDVYQGMQKPQ